MTGTISLFVSCLQQLTRYVLFRLHDCAFIYIHFYQQNLMRYKMYNYKYDGTFERNIVETQTVFTMQGKHTLQYILSL